MNAGVAFLAYTAIAGFLGLANRLYMAGFLLSSESINHPSVAVRYWYRYCVFSLSYFLSLIFSLALFSPLFAYLKRTLGTVPGYVLPLCCLPLALLIYWLDCRISLWSDGRKKAARDAFLRSSQMPSNSATYRS